MKILEYINTIKQIGNEVAVDDSNMNTLEILHKIKGHISGINRLSISPSGTVVASGSIDNSIKYWDLETGNLIGREQKNDEYWEILTIQHPTKIKFNIQLFLTIFSHSFSSPYNTSFSRKKKNAYEQ